MTLEKNEETTGIFCFFNKAAKIKSGAFILK
jgi:hypothetical protein